MKIYIIFLYNLGTLVVTVCNFVWTERFVLVRWEKYVMLTIFLYHFYKKYIFYDKYILNSKLLLINKI